MKANFWEEDPTEAEVEAEGETSSAIDNRWRPYRTARFLFVAAV